MVAQIELKGLRDFQLGLRKLDAELPRQLRVLNKQAGEIVLRGARGRAYAIGGVAAKAAESLTVVAQQLSVGVRVGGARYPFGPGAEFGGGKFGPGNPTPRGGHTTQFKAWRGNGHDAGYFLLPSARSSVEKVANMLGDLYGRLAKQAFPD